MSLRVRGLWGAALLAGLGAARPAGAAGPEVWGAMHDARLSQSADRDGAEAITIYETLLEHLGADDPLRGELLMDLARVRFDIGDEAGAREALLDASADPRVGTRARAWLVQLEAWARRVRTLPLELAVRREAGPLVLGWSAAPDAALAPSNQGLVWDTVVRDGRDDTLIAAIDELAGPTRHLGLRVRASTFPAHLRVVLEDAGGGRWATPVEVILPGDSTTMELDVVDLLPTGAAEEDARPDPALVRILMLQDVTAFHSVDRGPNRLTIEALSLR